MPGIGKMRSFAITTVFLSAERRSHRRGERVTPPSSSQVFRAITMTVAISDCAFIISLYERVNTERLVRLDGAPNFEFQHCADGGLDSGRVVRIHADCVRSMLVPLLASWHLWTPVHLPIAYVHLGIVSLTCQKF